MRSAAGYGARWYEAVVLSICVFRRVYMHTRLVRVSYIIYFREPFLYPMWSECGATTRRRSCHHACIDAQCQLRSACCVTVAKLI